MASRSKILLLATLAFASPARAEDPCAGFAAFVKSGVPADLLRQALTFRETRRGDVKNQSLLAIADYSRNSREARFHLLDLGRGTVEHFKVSHGSGEIGRKKYGDPDHDGMLDRCAVDATLAAKFRKHPRGNMTRPGFFLTAELYLSADHLQKIDKHGALSSGWPNVAATPKKNALRMVGLTPRVNDDALTHGVVMHGAWYNQQEVMGRSYGCPAFTPDAAKTLLPRLADGVLFYASAPVCGSDMKTVLAQVPGWEKTCAKE